MIQDEASRLPPQQGDGNDQALNLILKGSLLSKAESLASTQRPRKKGFVDVWSWFPPLVGHYAASLGLIKHLFSRQQRAANQLVAHLFCGWKVDLGRQGLLQAASDSEEAQRSALGAEVARSHEARMTSDLARCPVVWGVESVDGHEMILHNSIIYIYMI